LSDKILFLTLRTFSITGGIEKVSKLAGKVLYELTSASSGSLLVYSMYDRTRQADERYFPKEIFRGFGIRKVSFVLKSIWDGRKSDVVVLSHINLLPVGYLIKLLSPKTKLVLIAHGIEVWERFNLPVRKIIERCDKILAVSRFTRDQLIHINNISPHKVAVVNNCLDPYLQKAVSCEKSTRLMDKYGLTKQHTVLMTLSRLASRERYKGCDKVIQSMARLKAEQPGLTYLLVGKYDSEEKKRLDNLIVHHGLEDHVVFTGFIPDDEMAAHFNLADIYIMPSEKEGFGIVFIEAMHYGKPVIAGNKDGSVDAMLDGQLGLLVDPGSVEEIAGAIKKIAEDPAAFVPDRQLLMSHFSYETYKERWKGILCELEGRS
jgi:glycosyltransferase involved in cell wall biosynthesis